MRTVRNNPEKLTDALFSLVLLDLCASESGIIGNRLKVTKLIFLATFELLHRQIKRLNYSFYRYAHGPFTTELYETWGELCWMGYLDVPTGAKSDITVTESGHIAASQYLRRLEAQDNAQIINVFRQVCDSYASLGTNELLKHVNEMQVTPVGWHQRLQVKEIPSGTYLTCVLDSNEAEKTVVIDDVLAAEFFNQIPRATRPEHVSDAAFREIYASAVRGTSAEKAGVAGTRVRWQDLERKLKGDA